MIGQSALNIVPLLCSNRVGEEKEKNSSMTFFGSSFMTDCYGNVIDSMDRVEEGVKTASFDLDDCAKKRRDWGIFRDRRPDMYEGILSHDGEGKKR